MKLRTLLLLSLTAAFSTLAGSAWAQPQVSAPSAILMERETGQVLFAKNAHEVRPPASTTKILTALLAVELAEPDEVVTISKSAAATGEASIHLRAGEQLTVRELLKGALIKSGNDAAAALAEHIGGSIDFFAVLMNQKARLLGAADSNFVNPHGLPDKRHATTAYDLALIARFAMSKDLIADIVDEKEETIPWGFGQGQRYLKNTNRLLWRYNGADGVKTGTTNAAGQCLIASASRDKLRLLSVVLKSGNRYGDSIEMLDFGFNSFSAEIIDSGSLWGSVTVNDGTKNQVPVKTKRSLALVFPKDQQQLLERRITLEREVNAPVAAGEQLGELSLYIANEKKTSVPLIAASAAAQQEKKRKWWPF